MKILLAAVTLSLTSLTAPAAFAQLNPSPAQNLMADTNGDGRVSLAEYQSSRRAFFLAADRNRDKQITKAEWDGEVESIKNRMKMDGMDGADKIGHGGWWDMINLNKDGIITEPEIDAMTKARFAKFDLDKNGLIDKREADAVDKQTGLQRRR